MAVFTAKEIYIVPYTKKMVKLHPKYDKLYLNLILSDNHYSMIGLWLPFRANLPYREIGADAKQ